MIPRLGSEDGEGARHAAQEPSLPLQILCQGQPFGCFHILRLVFVACDGMPQKYLVSVSLMKDV